MKELKILLLALLLLVPTTAMADYWVTYAGDGTRMPIRLDMNVDWTSGDTKIVSEEVVGAYSAHSDFTVTEVTATGAEVNGLTASSAGGMNTGVTAFATGGQGSATALSLGMNNVTTVATAGDSVKLPTAATGNVVRVKNSGATALDIFPNTSDSIDALAANLAVSLDPGGTAQFHAISVTVWESNVDASLTLNAPTTAKGSLRILAANNDAETITTITNAAMAQASVISIPDPGAATANIVLTDAANDGAVVTATSVELNYNDITTLGTGAASKTVALDAGEDYTWPATGVLTYGGTGVTANGAELNYNDITTLGTGAASKSVVLDASSEYKLPAGGHIESGRGRVEIFDDFTYETLATTGVGRGDWIVFAGGDADATAAVVEAGIPEGQIIIGSGGAGAADDGSTMSLILLSQGSLVSLGMTVFETRVSFDQVTGTSWCFGLSDTLAEATERNLYKVNSGTIADGGLTLTNAVALCFDTDATASDKWQFVSENAGTIAAAAAEDAHSAGPAADTYAVIRIEVDSSGDARTYLNGTLINTETTAVATTSLLIPFIGGNSADDADVATDVHVDYIYFSHARPASDA
jgi:hypothetical protein